MDTKTELISMCERIVREIESGEYDMEDHDRAEWGGPCGSHYLSDALDIEYTVSSSGYYLGSQVCVAFGGPSIYIDTRNQKVQGYWGGDYVERSYSNDALCLGDCLEDNFVDLLNRI
jgi:hypothetical protein